MKKTWDRILCYSKTQGRLIALYPGGERGHRITVHKATGCVKDPKYQRKKKGLSYTCRWKP
jgi:hypothetical protein